MMDIKIIDVSGVFGLMAMIALTINILLGMVLSTPYKTFALWKKLPEQFRRYSINDLHNVTAYIALSLVFIHPLLLLLDTDTGFTFTDILFPVAAPHQKLIVTLGTISMFALVIVIITTQKVIKRKISFRAWKNIHLISYGTALLFFIHGIAMDPLLKDRDVDYFDGEKFLCEGCLILVIAAAVIRYRYYARQKALKNVPA
jgi:sulfoxide reductase heme-binding subunit YedZ